MLPKELLEAKKVRGKIYPKFADLKKDLPLAKKVIRIFKAGLGRKYGVVLKALREIENAENYRKVRGFAKVLENFCIDKACMFDGTLNPLEVRMFLFERGFVTRMEERKRIIEYAARYFNSTPEEVEKAMYADREEELILTKVEGMDAEELIRRYNLSLLQTALFNSTNMRFEADSNHKKIFGAIKFLGLMYDVLKAGKVVEVEVIGPVSLIKMTRKYGVSMAKLIPYIVSAENWRIEARIVENDRVYRLEVDSSIKHLLPESYESETFDSSLEAEFFRRIRNLGFVVEREPEVVSSEGKAFIPDFAVWKEGWRGKVFVEIAGFWTADYVKRKAEKVGKAKVPLILIASEEFGEVKAEGASFGCMEFVVFSKRIDYGKVLKAINRLADRLGIAVDVSKDVGEVSKKAGKKLSELKLLIERERPRTLEELESIVKSYGLTVNDDLLNLLGFKIVWKGLKPEIEPKLD